MENKVYQEEEIEIDLWRLFHALLDRIWMIILVAVIFALGAAAFTKFLIAPTYESTSTMLVLSKETTLTSLADLQLGSQLTQDYKVLITSRPVLQAVIDNLELDMEYTDLEKNIEIVNPEDTRILEITVTMPDPEMAAAVVNELSQEASEFIGDKMEVTKPKIIEDGEVPLKKSAPSTAKNTVLGFLLGAFLMCGVIVVLELLNDSIKTEEDIERYLGLPVLAVVPLRGCNERGKSRKSGKKQK
ncbi:MAG: polysaccharide export protein [Lachnospiraceae bacterium]|nr:polysaccharide export protein [Roseburia sp.]MBP3469194.1 polysaccharide export protein [Lachnospiraceae bacterium]